ncbi:MAG: pilus assembly protein N-terminal domain-containing protein [Myxococcales bacterium]|nr:pilus assembly protein N-terminal domain-containing protein [Myxococcales bacterium]
MGMALALALSASASAQDGREIRIRVGEQETLSAEGVRSYSEGVRGIADVRLTERQDRFIIAGMRPGTTSLLLIMRDGSQVQYRIVVESDQPAGSAPEIREGAVPARQNIRLDLYFVQLRDTYGHSIGIDYPVTFGTDQDRARINPQWTQGVGWNTTIQIISQTALPRVDIAQSRGWARLYRQAALVSVNGGESEINIGGELNVLTPGQLQSTLNQIPFGTILRATPLYDEQSGRIQIRLEADVSDLSEDGGTGVPGRTRSTLNTTVNLELGQSIVLGGVVARSESRSRSGLPGLSQIPILGAFFGVHGRRFEEAETLLFIVPTIIEPLPLTQRNRIQEAIRMYEEFSGGVDEVDLLDQPRVGGSAPRTVTATE